MQTMIKFKCKVTNCPNYRLSPSGNGGCILLNPTIEFNLDKSRCEQYEYFYPPKHDLPNLSTLPEE